MNAHPNPDDQGAPSDPGLSALYRCGATQEPPAEVDRRILGQARVAVPPPLSRWGRQPWPPRWLGKPLTAVAGLLLALGMTWHLLSELPPESGLTAPATGPGLQSPAPAPEKANQGTADASLAAPPALDAGVLAPAAREVTRSRPAPESVKAVKADKPLPAEPLDRLQAIRELLRAGHQEAAIAELAAFRRDHPQYPMPDDLAPLLPRE